PHRRVVPPLSRHPPTPPPLPYTRSSDLGSFPAPLSCALRGPAVARTGNGDEKPGTGDRRRQPARRRPRRVSQSRDLPHHRRGDRSEEHTSELQSPDHLVCRLLLEKKKHT